MAETAANPIPPQNDASTTHDGKGPQQPGGLATPEPTPGVEDGRAEAERVRRDKEVEDEIKRIIGSNSATSALGVDANSSEEDRIRAWQALGCKIHHEYCGYGAKAESNGEKKVYNEENMEALKKLTDAARELGVEERWIGEVETWNGEEDLTKGKLNDESESESENETDPANRMDQDSVPEPPERVRKIYENATPYLQKLADHPDDSDSHNALFKLNLKILKGNKAHNKSHPDNKVLKKTWEIPMGFFQVHYMRAQENYDIVVKDPMNDNAREIVQQEKTFIYDMVQTNHFPELWHINGLQLPPKPQESNSPEKSAIEYPWPTLQTDDGLIVGVRGRKIGGTQVCIETIKKDGRVIRRLESASDFGQAKVDQYMSIPDYKSLSNADSKYYRKDEADLKALHWVTMSRIKNKNTAKGKKDPPTDCCVEFHSKGLQMLTVSNVCNILGRKKGRAAIEKVCLDHGIEAPWNRPPQNTFYQPSKDGPKKTAAERWAEVDSLESPANGTSVNEPASNNGGGFEDPRVDLMSDKLDRLEMIVATLASTIDKLAASGKIEKSIFGY